MFKTLTPTVLLFSLIVFAASAVAQEAVVETDFKTPRLYETSYGFAGYGIEGEDGNNSVEEGISVKHIASTTGGNPDECLSVTFDTTKMKMPEDTSYDYVGWGGGSALELKNAWKQTDLENYVVSFDAKVTGTKSLTTSKFMLSFVADDDAVAKDDDENDDIVLKLVRGLEDGTDTFTLTNQYKTFTYNLKNDLRVDSGSKEALTKFDSKRVTFVVQAQGGAYDVGKDADNVLSIDNFRISKIEAKK